MREDTRTIPSYSGGAGCEIYLSASGVEEFELEPNTPKGEVYLERPTAEHTTAETRATELTAQIWHIERELATILKGGLCACGRLFDGSRGLTTHHLGS